MEKTVRILIYSSLLLASVAWGQTPTALYQADVTLAGSTAKEADFKRALWAVINRLTPGKNDPDNPVVQSALAKPLVQRSQITQIDKKYHLLVTFDPEKVTQLMSGAGQQPWITTRPKLLVWVIKIGRNGRELFVSDERERLYQAIREGATSKGLEVRFAEFDFSTIKDALRPCNSGEPEVNCLAELGKPLHPEATVLIELNTNEAGCYWEYWQVRYHNHYGSPEEPKRASAETVGYFAMSGISQHLFEWGEKKAVTPRSVYVNIKGINTLKAYREMRRFIEHMPGVVRASVNSVTEDAVLYTLDIVITSSLLDSRLRQKYLPLPDEPGEGIMNYQYSP